MKPGSLLLALASLTACVTPVANMPPPAPTPPPVETSVRGTVATSDAGFTLTPCDSTTAQPLEDATSGDLAKVWQMLGGTETRGVYLEGRLVDGRLVRIVRASPAEMNRCDETWTDVTFRARGNEPFWALDVTASELQWKTPEGEATLPLVDSSLGKDSLAWKGAEGERSLEVHAARIRCVDSMSGEVLPWTVQVNLDGEEFHGCASGPPGS